MTRRGEQTRSRILAAARELLCAAGPEALTLRAVAARAELSLGNLQFHYPDLDALLAGVLERELETGEAEVLAAAGDAPPLAAGIDALLDQHHDVGSVRLFFSLWAFAVGRPAVKDVLRRFYAAFVARVAAHLPPGPDAEERAWLIVAMLEGASVLRSLEPRGELPHDAALRALLRSLSG